MPPEATIPKGNKVLQLLIALVVGLVIGILFKSLKLPVPVPHGLGGLVGLIGMYLGSELVGLILNLSVKK